MVMLWRRCYRVPFSKFTLLAVVLTSALCLSLWCLSVRPDPSLPYQMHKLPSDDRTTLIDVRDFDFRLNNFPCNDMDSLLLLVLVHSAPSNVENRHTIRETWGHFPNDVKVKLLFLFGAVDSPAVQEFLEEENRKFRDVVQGSFRDNYRNITYKHVMALKWTTYYCPNARYLLKTDDDVFVNSPLLVNLLSQSHWRARRLILCNYNWKLIVVRSLSSKWFVSKREYAARDFPPCCSGYAVLYSPDVVFLLYREAQRAEYFWIDDVHVTGTLAARVNLTQTALGSLVLTETQTDALIGASRYDNGSSIGAFLFGAPNLPPSSIHKLWNVVHWLCYSARLFNLTNVNARLVDCTRPM